MSLIDNLDKLIKSRPLLRLLKEILRSYENSISSLGITAEYKANVTLTQADILTLNSVGTILIPSSEIAADEVPIITSFIYKWTYGGTIFTAGQQYITMSTIGDIGINSNTIGQTLGVLNLTKDIIGWGSTTLGTTSYAGLKPGIGIVLTTGGAVDDPTGGHADTTCEFTVTYKKVKV